MGRRYLWRTTPPPTRSRDRPLRSLPRPPDGHILDRVVVRARGAASSSRQAESKDAVPTSTTGRFRAVTVVAAITHPRATAGANPPPVNPSSHRRRPRLRSPELPPEPIHTDRFRAVTVVARDHGPRSHRRSHFGPSGRGHHPSPLYGGFTPYMGGFTPCTGPHRPNPHGKSTRSRESRDRGSGTA